MMSVSKNGLYRVEATHEGVFVRDNPSAKHLFRTFGGETLALAVSNDGKWLAVVYQNSAAVDFYVFERTDGQRATQLHYERLRSLDVRLEWDEVNNMVEGCLPPRGVFLTIDGKQRLVSPVSPDSWG